MTNFPSGGTHDGYLIMTKGMSPIRFECLGAHRSLFGVVLPRVWYRPDITIDYRTTTFAVDIWLLTTRSPRGSLVPIYDWGSDFAFYAPGPLQESCPLPFSS